MALDAAKKTSLYQALGLPQTDTVLSFGLDPNGTAIPLNDAADISIIRTAIDNALTRILDSADETRLAALLTKWDAVADAGTGEITQADTLTIKIDAANQRRRLRIQMETILGVHVPEEFIQNINGGESPDGCFRLGNSQLHF